MFSRASSVTALSRSCRYLLRSPYNPATRASASFPLPYTSTQRASFSLTARSPAAFNAMADTSGITADSLKNKLIDTLQALHVEVEDLSGMDLFRMAS
jgi:hypothetical protein